MEKSKHFINVFFTDNEEGYLCNFEGMTDVMNSDEQLRNEIGKDIHCEILQDMDKHDEAIYGYRIDYTLTPITKDPFK